MNLTTTKQGDTEMTNHCKRCGDHVNLRGNEYWCGSCWRYVEAYEQESPVGATEMTQFAFPRTDLIGQTIVIRVSNDDAPEYRTIVDAGNMTGGNQYNVILDDESHFQSDSMMDWQVVRK